LDKKKSNATEEDLVTILMLDLINAGPIRAMNVEIDYSGGKRDWGNIQKKDLWLKNLPVPEKSCCLIPTLPVSQVAAVVEKALCNQPLASKKGKPATFQNARSLSDQTF
jgi:hypothetical protein